MKYSLPQLPYSYDALEPFIDARTMEIHHTKHHQTYVTKLNEALGKYPELFKNLDNKPELEALAEILRNLDAVPEEIRKAVQNHGGGHINHSLYWTIMAPPQSDENRPAGEIAIALDKTFGGFDNFKEAFSQAALNIFGSGWGWLVVTPQGELKIATTPNQNSPFMDNNTPILGIDMWEHAFYLLRQNRKNEYVDAWWHVVNWQQVNENYQKVK
jgi:Fe-Mn family superoxide dismutase